MIRELYKQRWSFRDYQSRKPGWYEPEFIRDMKALSDYVMDNVPWYNPVGKMYKQVNAEFSKKYPGKYIDTNSGYAYLGVMVIADALERAKSTKPENIVAALRKTYLKQDLMVGGAVTFDQRGDNVNADSAWSRSSRLPSKWCCPRRQPKPNMSIHAKTALGTRDVERGHEPRSSLSIGHQRISSGRGL